MVSAGYNYYVSVHAKEILLAHVTLTSRPAYQLGNEVSNEGLIRENGGKEWEGSELSKHQITVVILAWMLDLETSHKPVEQGVDLRSMTQNSRLTRV